MRSGSWASVPRVTAVPEHRPRPDGELLERQRAGDEQAFVELVRAHHPAMIRLATAYVGSRAEAEEVAQQAWTAVLGALRTGTQGRR